MRIRLDRTVCDGFGSAPSTHPSTSRSTTGGTRRWWATAQIPEDDHEAVMRALLDCPVHAIIDDG